jgi:signal transduction histidine kinase
LNAIIGFSEVMGMQLFGKLGAEQYDGYVRDIHDSGQHLLSLINDLLDLSKIEAGRYTLTPERCPAGNLLDTCLRLVRDRATIGGLRLSSEIAPGTPDLFVDRRAALQIITNLLSNAVKFTPANGSVHLKVAPADGTKSGAKSGKDNIETRFVAITVRDTGIGIAKADIPKVLAAFGQVDNSLTRKHDGTGLGLPIVRARTVHQGGTLAIVSEPGNGTSVRVTVPSAAMPAPAREAVQETLI